MSLVTKTVRYDITPYVAEERFWMKTMERKHYTGHLYRNSPYETDDSCGNCDGARCDYCKLVTEPAHYECSVPVNILEDILNKHFDITDDCRSELVYGDRNSYIKDGVKYILIIPSEFHIKNEKYNESIEFYKNLLSTDKED